MCIRDSCIPGPWVPWVPAVPFGLPQWPAGGSSAPKSAVGVPRGPVGGPGWGSLLWRCRMTQRTRRGGSWWHLAPQGSPLDHWGGYCAFGPRCREKTSMNGNRPNHRPRAAPGPSEHLTPPGMTPGDSQDRPKATGARGLATHHRYVPVAGSLQPADLRPWRPNLASCGRLGGRAGP